MMPIARILRPLAAAALLAAALPASAQPGTDDQLAREYMRQGEYEKALLYLEKIYDKQPTAYWYEQLIKAQSALGRYDEAEKLAKERMRRQGDDPVFLVDIGALRLMQGDTAKGRQQFDKALKALRPDQAAVRNLANAFSKYDQLGLALETYERGRRLIKDGASDFFYETAALRAAQGDVPGMMSDYLDLLTVNPAYMQAVQNGLGRFIDFTAQDSRSEGLRTELLRRIQKEPDNTLFQEMLIWLYIQRKDLNAAFVQSKAMDKRFKEDGERIMALGDMAVTNKDWDVAAKCYGYVAERGAGSPWYAAARTSLVTAMDARVRDMADPPQDQLAALRAQYESTLAELGRDPSGQKLITGLARLKAWYLGDPAGGAEDLRQAVAMPGLSPQDQARMKLDLGDILVLQGDIWEASLLYSQVDLGMKQDILGHEARLRNAKVSFYAGDFLWAKAQLDVLKASTSKLIANDAMELSLLIDDNLGTDTVSMPLGLFAHAQLLTAQHKFTQSLAVLDSLAAAWPQSPLGDDILYERFRIAQARHLFPEAAEYLRRVVELYPNDILVDNAMFDLGLLYEGPLNDKAKALEWFGKLLFEQSGSIYTTTARDHYRHLRGDHDQLDTPEQKFLNGPQ
jgi:tetratricopeptide (TPR) repeat protein